MALKKKLIRQASQKHTSFPNKKRTPALQKSTPAPKKGVASPQKRTGPPQKGTARRKTAPSQRARPSRARSVTAKTLEALNDRLDIMLPEVMFRIAAIEHLLVKNQLCLFDELTNARQFIQEQERT
ncbi:MAG: hypothetical protein CO149_02690 [Nitrospirae bacterium CG_4_9_14_3_um_filter_51_5]|nr:MAG: hypothetical protein CO149_02690 [Nitrospirae bacterium CG_4_9_14_3_um_filter_51_5]